MKGVFAAVVILLLLFVAASHAQSYPATIKVPVTLYDYHSNGSNPDFNPGSQWPNANASYVDPGLVSNVVPNNFANVVQNLAAPTLTNGHPTRGTASDVSYYIDKWYQPWPQGNDFLRPVYNKAAANAGRVVTVIPPAAVGYDTSYKNLVFHDSLTFTYVPNSAGQYLFVPHPELAAGTGPQNNPQNQNFWPLDGRGFGNEITTNWNGTTINLHNYSFAMQIHQNFTYVAGLNFNFEGDDDGYVFVNGKLVLDLGGIHQVARGGFTIDNNGNAIVTNYNDAVTTVSLGLVQGNSYALDFFYAEREADASDIKITSNIIASSSITMNMAVVPNVDTISAGASQVYTAHVMNSANSECPACEQNVHWSLAPFTSQSTLSPASKIGQTTTFNAVDAYTKHILSATFDSTPSGGEAPIHLSWTDTFYVKPGPATHLNIESVSDSTVSLLNDNTFAGHSVVLPGATLQDSVYAVLRDAFGNWVSHATLAAWRSTNSAIVTASATASTQGEGLITRVVASGTDSVIASQAGFSDTIKVVLLQGNPPAAPSIVYPAAGAISVPVTVSFRWHPVGTANTYRLQVSTTPDFNGIVKDSAGLTDTTVTLTNLSNNTGYYWCVNATNIAGTSSWSGTATFTTVPGAPGPVVLVSPLDTAKIQADLVLLVWNKATPAVTKYLVQIATDSGMSHILLADSTVTDTSTIVMSLAANTSYWWQVKAYNSAGWGTFSTKSKFTIVPSSAAPKQFQLQSLRLYGGKNILRYALPKSCFVSVKYYDVKGRSISTFVNKMQEPGYYALPIQVSALPTGTYVQVFNAGSIEKRQKVTFVR